MLKFPWTKKVWIYLFIIYLIDVWKIKNIQNNNANNNNKNNLKDGRHRGIAYVEYEKREDAENAVKYMDQVNLFIYLFFIVGVINY